MFDKYWSSHSSYEGPGYSYHSDGFMVSVVLDAGTKRDFSGIRLIITYEETDIFNNLLIRDCVQTARHGVGSPLLEPTSNRSLILTHRRTIKEREGNAIDPAFAHPPLFVITLQVILQRMGDRFRAELEPQGSDPTDSLRVAYDEIFLGNSGSMVNFFESNVSFRYFDKGTNATPHAVFKLRDSPRGVPAYSIRILPVAPPPPSFHALPPAILQAIAEAAIDHRIIGWRSKLLSMASVCKAWSCMLDVFFIVLTSETCTSDPPNPITVARSLEMKPERGKLMRCFRLEDYDGLSKGIDNEERYITRCRAILIILKWARNIKSIHLPAIHKSLQTEFMQILSSLECVERCTIYDHDSHMGKIAELNVGEIQQFIAKWTELQCNIEDLRLRTSHLTGRQFVRFTSSHLRKVELERLNGPLNRDLLSFLSSAAPSLASLTIRSCPFLRQSMHEQYAIDALMPHLHALEELTVSGDLLTARAIADKPPGEHSSLASFTATLSPALYIDDLADALETGGWKSVTIKTLPGFMDETELWMKQQALETAARRDIVFEYDAVC
ncbi:hypothetical protein DXG01_003197 [Tephrocybe rancida]|nr:hypothetical protein DXG01_003197 [Tephrocybe rancida]